MTFAEERAKIVSALITAGISEGNIIFKRHIPPTSFPSAFVYLMGKQGMNRSRHLYNKFDHIFRIVLVADVHNADDPDAKILELEDSFRSAWINAGGDDFASVTYNISSAGSGRRVMLAEMSTSGGIE